MHLSIDNLFAFSEFFIIDNPLGIGETVIGKNNYINLGRIHSPIYVNSCANYNCRLGCYTYSKGKAHHLKFIPVFAPHIN